MADTEEKRHRVRLGAGGIIYEKPYPDSDTLVIEVPGGAAVEIGDGTYQALKRMNDNPGRPTTEMTRLGDGDAVDISLPDIVAKVDADMRSRGLSVTSAISAPAVRGRYKGMFSAGASVPSPFTSGVEAEEVDPTTGKSKGGK